MPVTKLCECGCGQPTSIVRKTSRERGIVAGQPRRFILGHGSWKAKGTPRWLPEDRGYATPCHIWQGPIFPGGYPRTSCFGRPMNAHRVVYIKLHGPLPRGMHVDHLCRVRSCVNPEHLEAVPAAENTRRGLAAKLTAADVAAIRADGRPRKVIAQEYGVGIATIGHVRSGRCWRDEAAS